MLEHLGEDRAGKTIEKAVMEVTGRHIKSLAAGKMGLSTTEVGDMVSKYVYEMKE
jgi:3-isopropylmalate dehydrogenase